MMINKMTITNAKYNINKHTNHKTISCIINGVSCSVPINLENAHYAEIKRQVDAGELTIEEAD